ncbi:MAG: trehalose-phosphatase [Woeseiaceae bacterium]
MSESEKPQALTRERNWALFLDVDGTLLDIEDHPDLVLADSDLQQMIDDLSRMHSGAVALISGRSLSELDRIFDGLEIPAAGSHGHELRLPDGSVEDHAFEIPQSSIERLEAFAHRRSGLHLEHKPSSVALHYRAAPDLAEDVVDRMTDVRNELGDEFSIIRGKMVVELLPAFADKGSAVRYFMTMRPFAGRQPVFIGDDVTDEAGFDAANTLGGHSIRIGARAGSAAKWCLPDVDGLHAWLRSGLGSCAR